MFLINVLIKKFIDERPVEIDDLANWYKMKGDYNYFNRKFEKSLEFYEESLGILFSKLFYFQKLHLKTQILIKKLLFSLHRLTIRFFNVNYVKASPEAYINLDV